MEVSAQVVWVADAEGRPRDGSPSLRPSGKTEEAGVGWSWLDAIHPDDRERVWRCWQQALASRSDYEVAFRTQDAEGGYRQVVARAVPLLAEDGSVREWIGMNTDVSERERALERLRRSEAVLAEAEHMAHLGAWWTERTASASSSRTRAAAGRRRSTASSATSRASAR